jgi:hypothetical protein
MLDYGQPARSAEMPTRATEKSPKDRNTFSKTDVPHIFNDSVQNQEKNGR